MPEHSTYLVFGPTASGKSEFAILLAQKTNGIILCADSLQIYRDYRVLTARPSLDDEARAEHQLFGYLPANAPYSVGDWLNALRPYLSFERPLIITGGTGLYFRALTQGLVNIPKIPQEIVENFETLFREEGLAALQAVYQQIPNSAINSVDYQNSRRLIRALSVYHFTGQSLTSWQKATPPPDCPLAQTEPILILPQTELSAQSIQSRFYAMIDEGAIDEVQALMNPWNADDPANKAIGAKELAAYLFGEMRLDEAVERAVTATLQYAKRQRSFARSNMKDWSCFESWQAAWAHYAKS